MQLIERNFSGARCDIVTSWGRPIDLAIPAESLTDTAFRQHSLHGFYPHRNFLGMNLRISIDRNVVGAVIVTFR